MTCPTANPVGYTNLTKMVNSLSELAVLVTHGSRYDNFNALNWYGATVHRSFLIQDKCNIVHPDSDYHVKVAD